jgi:transcriptional regulator with GAF, ATPase, and Fis domain
MTNNRIQKYQNELGIIGQSDGIVQIFQVIEQVAATNISVLIIGESGTGKELVAKAIHARSLRAEKPLVIVNCGAIPEGIIESELFGHEKGAFTGAIGPRKGFFESANGGTVFLDEIGEMPLNAQVKILRVLEGKEFMRVGGSEPHQVDVRIIAATNRDLGEAVRQGNFRQDLYFRLRAVNVQVPPLRTRRSDIFLLAQKFADNFCQANKIDFKGFDPSAKLALENYHWPGNVRELKNLVESAIVLEKGNLIDQFVLAKYLNFSQEADRFLPVLVHKSTAEADREFIYRALIDLKTEISQLRELILTRLFPPKRLRPWEKIEPITVHHDDNEILIEETLDEATPTSMSMQDMEKELIINSLRKNGGNKRKTAKSLKISERTLYRKIKEYGLETSRN